MATDDQSAVVAFLSDGATYGMASKPIRIDTHGAIVFLADKDVYKIKRAVAFSSMDFSTLERRKAACQAEIAVNRENAPDIYLGAVPITRDERGLHINGKGEVVEWAVHLHRFDENATLDRIAERNGLTPELIDRLAETVFQAHKKAPIRKSESTVAALHHVIDETIEELTAQRKIFPADFVAHLRDMLLATFHENKAILSLRASSGHVRRCHGDLHLRNIVLKDKVPLLFDAIEFNEAIATIDTLYDVAFLVMDLCQRGMAPMACRFLNRYMWLSANEADEVAGLVLFPLFLALRAAIRANVLAVQAELTLMTEQIHAQIHSYAQAALAFLVPVQARVIAIGGLSGSGKSTVAATLAADFGSAPGALHLRSDIERKKMFAAGTLTRLDVNAYTATATSNVYRQLADLARIAIGAGRSVIIDATFLREDERFHIEQVAKDACVSFTGLWLDAPLELLVSRVQNRRADVSDATQAVVLAQAKQMTGKMTWQKINASAAADAVAQGARLAAGISVQDIAGHVRG